MNGSSDAAEAVVKMSFQGIDYSIRIVGDGAKHIAAFLLALFKNHEKIKGKTRLVNMLKSGHQLKIFTIKESDFKKFAQEAKKYGVLYSAIKNTKGKDTDEIIDVMVKAEDSSKINRIVKRFQFAQVASVTAEKEKKIQKTEKIVDDILTSPKQDDGSNPNMAKMEKSPLSEPTLENKNQNQGTNSSKKSVKEEIKKIKDEQKKELGEKQNVSKNKQKNKNKKGKVK